jgi:hypothetical protein
MTGRSRSSARCRQVRRKSSVYRGGAEGATITPTRRDLGWCVSASDRTSSTSCAPSGLGRVRRLACKSSAKRASAKSRRGTRCERMIALRTMRYRVPGCVLADRLAGAVLGNNSAAAPPAPATPAGNWWAATTSPMPELYLPLLSIIAEMRDDVIDQFQHVIGRKLRTALGRLASKFRAVGPRENHERHLAAAITYRF